MENAERLLVSLLLLIPRPRREVVLLQHPGFSNRSSLQIRSMGATALCSPLQDPSVTILLSQDANAFVTSVYSSGMCLSNCFCDFRFHAKIIAVTIWWKWRQSEKSEVRSQDDTCGLVEPSQSNDSRNPSKVLTTFDFNAITTSNADVQILANGTETSTDTSSVS